MTPEMWLVIIGGVIGIVAGAIAAIIAGCFNLKQQKKMFIFERNKRIREERIIAYQTYLRALYDVEERMQTIIEKIDNGIPPPSNEETWGIYKKFVEESIIQKILFSDNIEKSIDVFFAKSAKTVMPISDPEEFVKSVQKLMKDLLGEIKKPIKEEIFQLAKIKEK